MRLDKRRRTVDLFNPQFEITRHKVIFEKSDNFNDEEIPLRIGSNDHIPSLLFPYFLFFDIVGISDTEVEYQFSSFNSGTNEADAFTIESKDDLEDNFLIGLSPIANSNTDLTNIDNKKAVKKDDYVIAIEKGTAVDNKDHKYYFGKMHNDNRLIIDGHYERINISNFYRNIILDSKSHPKTVTRENIFEYYDNKIEYFKNANKRLNSLLDIYKQLPVENDLIKNFIVNYESILANNPGPYAFDEKEVFKKNAAVVAENIMVQFSFNNEMVNTYAHPIGNNNNLIPRLVNLQTLFKDSTGYTIKDVSWTNYVNISNEIKKIINFLLYGKETPTTTPVGYINDFFKKLEFKDIFDNIIDEIKNVTFEREALNRSNASQTRLNTLTRSTNVEMSTNKTYVDELASLLDKFTESLILIMNTINLIFVVDAEQVNKTEDNKIKYIDTTTKILRHNTLRVNFDNLVDAVNRRSNIEHIYIPKNENAFKTYNINKNDEAKKFQEVKMRCTAKSRETVSEADDDAAARDVVAVDWSEVQGGAHNMSARIPASAQELVNREEQLVKRIEILTKIYESISEALGNYKVPENVVGDTYYTFFAYKSSKFFKKGAGLQDNNAGGAKPVYVFGGPAMTGNPGNVASGSHGICVWLTTSEELFRKKDILFKKLKTDTGFDYAYRGHTDSYDNLYIKTLADVIAAKPNLNIYTDTDHIPDHSEESGQLLDDDTMNINPYRKNYVESSKVLREEGDVQRKCFLKIFSPYLYNLTKVLDMSADTSLGDDLLDST